MFEIKGSDSGAAAVFPGQPPYTLRPTGTNLFDLSGLSGYSVTFVEVPFLPGRVGARLRHPGGTIVCLKQDEAWLERAKAQYDGPDKELIGSYHSGDQTTIMEIVPYQAGVALIITDDLPMLLKHVGGGLYQFEGVPDTLHIRVKRSADGRVLGFTFIQPGVSLEMSAAIEGDAEKALAILERAVAAAGGAEAIDRIASLSAFARASAPTHGLEGIAEDHIAGGKRAEIFDLGAFGKIVFKSRVLTSEAQSLTFLRAGEPIAANGKALLAARFFAVPHQLYRWKERFVSAVATRETSVNGEDAVVIELTPKELAPLRVYISTKSFLILREEIPTYIGDELQPAVSAEYSDYRAVNGVQLPFAASLPAPLIGRVTVTYDRVSLNEAVNSKTFEVPRP